MVISNKERCKRYYYSHKEKAKAYYIQHKEKILKQKKFDYEKNPKKYEEIRKSRKSYTKEYQKIS